MCRGRDGKMKIVAGAQEITGAEAGGAPPAAGVPAHQVIYEALRALILFGELAPGEAVTIAGLSARMEAGITPVREAIRRLTAEGALAALGNRRVIVPELSVQNISEIIYARHCLDPELARRATLRAKDADIARLEVIDAALDLAIMRGDQRQYLEQNYRFHACFYDLSDAPVLADMARGLWLRFGPSLRVICGRLGTQNLPDMHKSMLAAMRAGDADAAAAAMREGVGQGMGHVAQSLEMPLLSKRFD